MTDADPNSPDLPPPCPAEADDWRRALTLRQLQMLGELAELGLEIAGAIERQAGGKADASTLRGDAALAYARVTRSVRQTMLLQSKLIEGMDAGNGAADEARAEAQDGADEASPEAAAETTPEDRQKARVERIVERLVTAEHPDDEDELDRLMNEACDRLDDEDLYGDLMERPVSELVARICRDLGLQPQWAELVQELWAQKEIESGAPGEPLRALLASDPGASAPMNGGARATGATAPEGSFPGDTG